MTDDTKELLTYAAKAAGIVFDAELIDIHGIVIEDNTEGAYQSYYWNPATDDGDSARLRTTLEISVQWTEGIVEVSVDMPLFLGLCEYFADHSGDKNAALRWATLRLAAEIGRRMKDD